MSKQNRKWAKYLRCEKCGLLYSSLVGRISRCKCGGKLKTIRPKLKIKETKE